MEDYQFVEIVKSKADNKKYAGILKNRKTGKLKTVNFGSSSNQQYFDSTGLGLYTHLNHNDKKKRENFKKRFARLLDKKYSATWFANKYLWS